MMKQHAVAMDANLATFTRVWVLLELHTAVMMRIQTQYFGALSASALLSIPSAQHAEASVADTKLALLLRLGKHLEELLHLMTSCLLTSSRSCASMREACCLVAEMLR